MRKVFICALFYFKVFLLQDLKEKIRRMGDDLNQKEKHVLQLNRSGSIDKV